MADAVIAGATDPALAELGVVVRHVDALEATPDDVRSADGLLLGTPENFGYMSGAAKYFFDRVYYPCLDHTNGLPFGLFVKAGNDGAGAIASVAPLVSGLGWKAIAEPLLCVGEVSPETIDDCHELGGRMAAGLGTALF